jgi:hypothetical protein
LLAHPENRLWRRLMLAPLSRWTLTVAAALLISFVDGTFDSAGPAAQSVDARTIPLALDDSTKQSGAATISIDSSGQQNRGTRGAATGPGLGLICTQAIRHGNGPTDVFEAFLSEANGECAGELAVLDGKTDVGTDQTK